MKMMPPYHGQSVRPVRVFSTYHEIVGASFSQIIVAFILSKKQLLSDLCQANKDARCHKRNKTYEQRFERHLETNFVMLRDELWSRTYKPRPSFCFHITDPKLREIFAADFRDRMVHHLYYNYVYEMFCRTFIEDS